MIVRAPAKINLSLKILGKRNDGFHDLESRIVFANFGDTLNVFDADSFSLEVDGPFAHHVPPENDLVAQAVHLLAKEAGQAPNVKIKLTKNLPAGAGLGGGSADAAAVLKALNDFWNLGYSLEKLQEIGLTLGSELPVCLYDKPALVTGRGEHVAPAPAVDLPYLLLCWPGVTLSTADVFKAFEMNDHPHNHLTDAAITCCPVVAECLERLGPTAQLNGSGSSCFAVFENMEDMAKVAEKIRAEKPDWWVMETSVG